MNEYIFITTEGYTFQPDSEVSEPDIENCQVIGFGKGNNAQGAFENMLSENDYLLETSFDEVICYELKNDNKKHFYLNDHSTN